jgi:hypothetical protein
MRALLSLLRTIRAPRLAPIVAAAGVVVALSGCVVYPAGDYGHHGHYSHERDWR